MLSFAVSALSLNLSPAVSRSANPVMAWQPMRGSAPLADQALALLIKCARANHERTCMERDALGLREWAVDMLGADSLDPREEPGWDDAFAEALSILT